MRDDLLDVLGSAGRRLRRVRALEDAAVGAIGGGLCAATLQVTFLLAIASRAAAIAFCAAALIVASVVIARLARRNLLVRQAIILLVLWWAGISLGAASLLSGLAVGDPVRLLFLIILPVGALATAAPALLRRVAPHAVAAVLDARASLRERMTTAAELAGSDDVQSPVATCVYRQALQAAERAGASRMPLWRRTRATAGLLGLVLVLCTALALLPVLGGAPVSPLPDRQDAPPATVHRETPSPVLAPGPGKSLHEMSSPERARLADALRRAAEAESDPSRASALRQLADATEDGDQFALDRAMEKLMTAGGSIPQEVAPALPVPLAGAVGPAAPERVAVYDPAYAEALAARKRAEPGQESQAPSRQDGFVPHADAWSAAKRRAADALRAARVPPEYRDLVRDFFLAAP